ncbi:MAG: hypothetical protein D3925_02520 [Candidatus Electrothrix sp. AR5]|nr:hypothetical protein [Candidatus Electrothrix sp. AR5]
MKYLIYTTEYKKAFEQYIRRGTPIRLERKNELLRAAAEMALRKVISQAYRRSFWGNLEMSTHFYFGNGRTIKLREMGHLNKVRSVYEKQHLNRFLHYMLRNPDGNVRDSFFKPYDFGDVLFAYGMSTMSGKFTGTIRTLRGGWRRIEGVAEFEFYDRFTDPLSLRQYWSEIHGLSQAVREFLMDNYEVWGTPYDIKGNWTAPLNFDVR